MVVLLLVSMEYSSEESESEHEELESDRSVVSLANGPLTNTDASRHCQIEESHEK